MAQIEFCKQELKKNCVVCFFFTFTYNFRHICNYFYFNKKGEKNLHYTSHGWSTSVLSDKPNFGLEKWVLGRIHLPQLQIHKYFTDDSSINVHDKVFLHFFTNLAKIEEKPCLRNLQMSRL